MQKHFLFIFFSGFFLMAFAQNTPSVDLCYNEKCAIEIDGTTNAAPYSCKLIEIPFCKDPVNVSTTYKNGKLFMNHLEIILAADGFKCDHKKMTSDFKKVLKSEEFPQLKIEFLQLDLKKPLATVHSQKNVNAQIAFTIAGVKKIFTVSIEEVLMQTDELIITGTIPLRMTDFNLEPPAALFGLVKAKNEIDVSFKLLFCVI